ARPLGIGSRSAPGARLTVSPRPAGPPTGADAAPAARAASRSPARARRRRLAGLVVPGGAERRRRVGLPDEFLPRGRRLAPVRSGLRPEESEELAPRIPRPEPRPAAPAVVADGDRRLHHASCVGEHGGEQLHVRGPPLAFEDRATVLRLQQTL